MMTDHKISFRDKGEYLLVTVSGPWIVDVLEEYIIEVRQRLDEFGHTRVLIDNQGLAHPGKSSFERFKVGEIIAREWGPYIKAAVITKPDNISGYTETTAVNRGANFAVFSNMEVAKEWLLS